MYHSVAILGFFVTQILREIKVRHFRTSKIAILAISEALEFDFLKISALQKCTYYYLLTSKFRASEKFKNEIHTHYEIPYN